MTLSRRQILQAGAGVAVAGGLAGCTGGDGGQYNGGGAKRTPGSAAKQIAPTPRRQTVVVDQRNMVVFDKFNPFIPNGEAYQGGVGQICKEYLFYLNLATGKVIPWLGRRWSYSDDFREMTIELNPKARWNDGKPFTSHDVEFSLELVKGNGALLGGGTATDEIESISTPDANTVVVKLNTPDPRYHYNFVCDITAAQVLVVPAHIWSKQDPTKFANNPPVYTGPYKLKDSIADRKMFVWERYDGYWNVGELDPKPRYVVYREVPATDAEFQQFKDAASDVNAEQPMYELVHNAIKGGLQDALITPMLDPCPDAVFANCDPSTGILADHRMRWVLSALTDRDRIGKSVWQIDTPGATYPWPAYPQLQKYENASIAARYPLRYDTKKAASLLDQMGARRGAGGKRHHHGKPLSFEIMTPAKESDPEAFMAQLLAGELKKQGIGASVRNLAGSPVFAERVQKGNYDIRQEWQCGATFDPWQGYRFFQSKYAKPIGKSSTQPSPYGNSVRLHDKAFDAAVAKLGGLDPSSSSAKPVFDEALDRWFEAMPAVMQIQKSFTHLFNTTFWTGWPTPQNLYITPNNWWGHFLFVIGKLRSTGR